MPDNRRIANGPNSHATEVDPDNIPAELKEYRQWVVWRYETRNGKRTKVPYTPRMKGMTRASSTDPVTWLGFGGALTVYQMCNDPGTGQQRYNGVGFVLTEDDPFVGVDLDHCIDPHTEEIAPWAQAIVDELNAYTEITPSGEGLRIICTGQLPAGSSGNKCGPIEMYSAKRYLTVTGHRLEQRAANKCRTLGEIHKND